VYFSVRWWNSLHQLQSSPQTVDATMVVPLRLNAFGMLFLACWFAWMRMRAASTRHALEMEEEP
jgi:heme exporter protein C